MHATKRCASQPWPLRRVRGGLCAGLLILASGAGGAVDYTLTIEGVTSGPISSLGFAHALDSATVGPAAHAELRAVKTVDRLSPVLLTHLCEAQPVPLVRVEAKETTADHVRYYAIQLREVLVTSLSVAATNTSDAPVESFSLNYAKIQWTYIETDASGLPGSASSTDWDLLANAGGVPDPDSDGDGLPDSYEISQALLPLTDDAGQDSDHDGMPNLDEFLSGTAAGDPTSVFRVTGLEVLGACGVAAILVNFNSVPGRVYDLYALSSLMDPLPRTPAKTVTATAPTTSVNFLLTGYQAFVRVVVRVP